MLFYTDGRGNYQPLKTQPQGPAMNMFLKRFGLLSAPLGITNIVEYDQTDPVLESNESRLAVAGPHDCPLNPNDLGVPLSHAEHTQCDKISCIL